ncbi:MAG: hypothetical protein HFE83_01015 [Lachnospiraceae bacterium]|jgi:hypothetical protein|nr:hypothetical protein [Lachnospiraceae bacterium]
MKGFRSREDSLKLWLSFFLLAGAVLGTLFCNLMDEEMKGELLNLEGSMVSAAALQRKSFSELFVQVAAERLSTLFLGFLFAMTQIAPLLFLGALGFLGFSSAVAVCALTMDAGLSGVLRYALFILPHCIFYVPVLYVLTWWMPVYGKKLKPAAALALTALTVFGAVAESFFNPWLMAYAL